jgi:hypothetical protein
MKRFLPLVAALLTMVLPATASAYKQYILRHPKHEHCRALYVRKITRVKRREHGRIVKVHETVCIYIAPKPIPNTTAKPPVTTITGTTTTPPDVKLNVHLDPSFTQNPADPLIVTYAYSASTEEDNIVGAALIAPSLPSGVLAFYSDGMLACSINVGDNTSAGECTIDYSHFGAHAVDAIYSSGETSATTGVETEQIEPPPVTVTVGAGAQSSTDPFAVSYPVSATAQGTLPDGTLTLTPDEGSSCTVPVGETTTTGDCLVNYSALGSHSVTLEYSTQGYVLALTSESEPLEPFSTATTESILAEEGPEYEYGCHRHIASSECEFTVSATTIGQEDATLLPSYGIEVTGTDTNGQTISRTFRPPAGAATCELKVTVWSAEGGAGGESTVESPDCSGRLRTYELPPLPPDEEPHQREIESWTIAATAIPTLGWTASHSEPQTLLTPVTP